MSKPSAVAMWAAVDAYEMTVEPNAEAKVHATPREVRWRAAAYEARQWSFGPTPEAAVFNALRAAELLAHDKAVARDYRPGVYNGD
jgi:hypothetical protein